MSDMKKSDGSKTDKVAGRGEAGQGPSAPMRNIRKGLEKKTQADKGPNHDDPWSGQALSGKSERVCTDCRPPFGRLNGSATAWKTDDPVRIPNLAAIRANSGYASIDDGYTAPDAAGQ
jgi:hypothetical protein